MKPIALSDLPPAYREQAERLLRAAPPQASVAGARSTGHHQTTTARPTCREALAASRTPNKTETRFNLEVLGGAGQYEALTLRLPGGSRYTPDYLLALFDPATQRYEVSAYEVKGTYRLGSHGRALTAFREARAAFPFLTFHWYERQKGGGWTEKYRS